MQNVSTGTNGKATLGPDSALAVPPHVDHGYALIWAIPPSAATLVHNAIMDMLRVPPAPPSRGPGR